MAAAKTDAPALRERPPKKRPTTKYLRVTPKPICPSVLKRLLEPITDPRRRGDLPPLGSSCFPHRVTVRTREIIRRSDGQLMLAALLGSEAREGPAKDGSST